MFINILIQDDMSFYMILKHQLGTSFSLINLAFIILRDL